MSKLGKIAISTIFSLFIAVFGLQAGSAEAASTYSASLNYSTGNGSLLLEPGQEFKVGVAFKNTGTATWKAAGPGYISLYTYDPKYRNSLFEASTWMSSEQTAAIDINTVAPGGIGTVYFDLVAPTEPGNYTETFHLAAEDRAWVEGGEFTYHIRVAEKVEEAPANDPVDSTSVSDANVDAELVTMTARRVKAKAGDTVRLQTVLKNTGIDTWNTVEITSNGQALGSLRSVVATDETAIVPIAFTTPAANGEHILEFNILANGAKTSETIQLTIDVFGGSDNTEEVELAPVIEYIDEPTIRVGLITVDEETDDKVVITAEGSAMTVTDLAGETYFTVPQGGEVEALYKNGVYTAGYAGSVITVTDGLRFVPSTPEAPLEISNFDRTVTRSGRYADNSFRGVLEMRYNERRDRVWMINELPIEAYLRGMAESDDASPAEYLRAMSIAERTYAYYHLLANNKWDDEYFHISGYSWDQVYLGYDREMRSDNITAASNETVGEVVTYEGALALTPYFSQSDGRTRDWEDVWSGTRAWVRSVSVPCDNGKRLLGHGVGMSATGAMCMARQGMTGEEILGHFFTDIEIEKKWE